MLTFNTQVTDVLDHHDLCVVGGGMAGLCAALAAAREGARTVLVHDRPVLGGCGSSEMRVPFSGAGNHNPAANETGIILELITEERAASPYQPGYGIVDGNWDLILYDKVRREPNLTVLLNTHVCHVGLEGDCLRSVVGHQLGTERVWEIPADFFIDATGDGMIGAAAGVPFRIGQESRQEYGESMAPEQAGDWTLGSSLIFRARDVGRPAPFTPPPWAETYPDEASLYYRSHQAIEGGYWWIEIGWPYDTIRGNDMIREELLRHVLGVWDHIKNHCEHRRRAANYVLDWIGMLPAKRESRRFIGAHVLTQTEICARTLFPDRVAYGGWLIDDHTRGGILERDKLPSFDEAPERRFYVPPYSVPLRSLHSVEVANLFFAGRVLSASRLAFNSLRVQRTLAVAGQAAGTAAAYCARTGRKPGGLSAADLRRVQQSLLRQDCYLPHLANEDPEDVARSALVTASGAQPLATNAAEGGLPLAQGLAQLLPLSVSPHRLRIFVVNETEETIEVRGGLHRAEDIWDLSALRGESQADCIFTIPAGHRGPVAGIVSAPVAAPALYWLRLAPAPGIQWLQAEPLPGLTAAKIEEGEWVFAPATFSNWTPLAAEALPLSRPFEPANIVNGVARPESWPNVWLSSGPAPQWCRLQLSQAVELDLIQIAWGLNFHRSYFHMPGFFRAPECARDYRIEVELENGGKAVWAEVAGNYQRLRCHPAPATEVGPVAAIIISVAATNGAPRVEIDEVRAYRRRVEGAI